MLVSIGSFVENLVLKNILDLMGFQRQQDTAISAIHLLIHLTSI